MFFGRERRVTQTPDVADAQSPKKIHLAEILLVRLPGPEEGQPNWRTAELEDYRPPQPVKGVV